MKIFAPILAALILSACSPPPIEQPVVLNATGKNVLHFIRICSGIDNVAGMIAVANCMGRIRGYSDGATVATQVHQVESLWCVDQSLTDEEVMGAVLAWVAQNNDKFNSYVDAFDPRTAAGATIIQSLREKFMCNKTT